MSSNPVSWSFKVQNDATGRERISPVNESIHGMTVTVRQTPVRILFADELTLMREGLVAICQALPQCEVVGQCSDGAAALNMIQELKPDIAILDINLPILFSFEVARKVRGEGLPTKIGIISARGDRKTVLEALRGGASAFLMKSGPAKQIAEAIHQMQSGGIYVSPLLNLDEIFLPRSKELPDDPFETLSPREFQVFSLLVEGVRAKEIAARLGLSPKTVDTYRSSLMQKLEIYDVAGLVKFAIHREFIGSR